MDKKEKKIIKEIVRRRKEARSNEPTTADIAQLLGAAKLIKKYAHHLCKHVDAAINNYESTDFDHVLFLADAQFTFENCDVVNDCILMVRKALRKMKNEISVRP